MRAAGRILSTCAALGAAALWAMFLFGNPYAPPAQGRAVTFGGLGLWWAFDVILVAAGGFRDGDGRLIADWDPATSALYERRQVPEAVLDELEALRSEMTELAERVDFAERLLARPREAERAEPDVNTGR